MQWLLLAQDEVGQSLATSWLTAGLLVTLLVIYAADKLLAYLKTRGIDLQKMHRRIEELHEWHNHDDPSQPGIKIWWNQRYLAEIIRSLAKNQADQMLLLRELARELQQGNSIQDKQMDLLRELMHCQEELARQLKEAKKGG